MMPVVVMAEVLRSVAGLVLAIAARRAPRHLNWHGQQQEDEEEPIDQGCHCA
jgi:hypothetical protein